MGSHDKVEQLRQSLQAKKEAEARKASARDKDASPGLEEQYLKKIEELEQALEKLEGEAQDLKKKAASSHEDLLRKHAEFENFRKRLHKEKEEMSKYGHENMAKELLPVLDSLEKAIEHADESHDFKDLMNGVQLVLRQFLQALEKFGIQPVEAVGQTFNPHVHEAVGHLESEEHPPDSVISEHRRGYQMHDRLLRPTMVSVSKVPKKKDPE